MIIRIIVLFLLPFFLNTVVISFFIHERKTCSRFIQFSIFNQNYAITMRYNKILFIFKKFLSFERVKGLKALIPFPCALYFNCLFYLEPKIIAA